MRLAARLARRDVRRRPGRTALVAVLVALPVAAMSYASVTAHTVSGPWSERYAREYGASDLAFSRDGGADAGTLAPGDLASVLPPGSHVTQIERAWAPMLPADPSLDGRYAQLVQLPASDPLTDGLIVVDHGRMPSAAGEVLVDPELARRWDVSVGDELRLERPDLTATVVGIGRSRVSGEDQLVMADAPLEQFGPGYRQTTTLIGLADGATADDVEALDTDLGRLVDPTSIVSSLHGSADEPSPQALAWGWAAGVLAMCVLGTVIVAAFATSARRQLAMLGQLAANGAGIRLVRRSVALQGAWTGAIGSAVGVAVGLVALPLARGMVERSVARPIGAFDVRPIEIAVIVATGIAVATMAASLPARTAARVPVLAALAGRRPLGRLPRRMVPLGVASCAAGVGILALVAAGSRGGGSANLFAGAAIVGGLAVLAGVCCISPAIVSAFEPLARHLRASGRIAARSTARLRTRSAAVVTAIAAVGAIAITAATLVSGAEAAAIRQQPVPNMPADTVVVTKPLADDLPIGTGPVKQRVDDQPEPSFVDADPALLAGLRDALPGATWTSRRYATFASSGLALADLQQRPIPPMIDIADDVTLGLIALSAGDRARFEQTGALVFGGDLGPGRDGRAGAADIQLVAATDGGNVEFSAVVARDHHDTRGGVSAPVLMTEARARQLGFHVVEGGWTLRLPHPLDDREKTALQRLRAGGFATQAFVDAPPGGASQLMWGSPANHEAYRLVKLLVIATMLLFTLVVVATGLALSAAESRDERDALVTVGARPRTLRRIAAAKAALLSVSGAVLAIPAGFVPIAVVLLARRRHGGFYDPIVFPWSTVAAIAIAIPLAAGLLSWVASAIGQQLRPMRMSTLSPD